MKGKGPVVVGVDGSRESRNALRVAADEARTRGTKLRAVMAHPPLDAHWPGGFPLYDPCDADGARVLLADIVREELGDELDVEVELSVRCETAARALVEEADGASLLVLGARGLGGFRALLLGSVSQQVSHHAPCPLLIVRLPAAA